MASKRPGRVGRVKAISSPHVVLNLVMCGDGVDRWVLVDHGEQEAMGVSARARQAFVERMVEEVALGMRHPRSPNALPPMFTAMPTAEARELLAEDAPAVISGNVPRMAVRSPTTVRLH